MKNKKFNAQKLLSVVLAAILAVTLLLPLSVPAAVSDVTITVPLLSVIKYETKNKDPDEKEKEEIVNLLLKITQPAYDAFIMDLPLQSMWIDVSGSEIVAGTEITRVGGNKYLWRIKSLTNTVRARSGYDDPSGMMKTLAEALSSFTPEGDSLYEKVLSIHDYVCRQTEYDSSAPHIYSAYGALIDRQSVCEGYAEAFRLLCAENGIPCILVSGKGVNSRGEENHMWNLVKMDDGKWYAVDATWDDGETAERSYFLVGSQTVVNALSGTKFYENHRANGDISATGFFSFRYPELSEASYLENNPPDRPPEPSDSSEGTDSDISPETDPEEVSPGEISGQPGEDPLPEVPQDPPSDSSVPVRAETSSEGGLPGGETFADRQEEPEEDPADHYFFRQLDPEQQNYYLALEKLVAPGAGEEEPGSTSESLPSPDSDSESGEADPTESESGESTEKEPTVSDTTAPVTEPPTQPTETESQRPPVTDPPATAPEPPPATEKPTTDSPGTQPPEPTEQASESVPETPGTVSSETDFPGTSSEESQAETGKITFFPGERNPGDTTSAPTPSGRIPAMRIVRTALIVTAIAASFCIVFIILIRFSHSEKK